MLSLFFFQKCVCYRVDYFTVIWSVLCMSSYKLLMPNLNLLKKNCSCNFHSVGVFSLLHYSFINTNEMIMLVSHVLYRKVSYLLKCNLYDSAKRC